jgi:hypothetical protein
MQGGTVRGDRFEVSVTFDPTRGYVATAPELRAPVTALSLGALRRRIEALMVRAGGHRDRARRRAHTGAQILM